MFNFFNSNVWIEIGEAIGNVGSKALSAVRRHDNATLVETALRRRRKACRFEVPGGPGPFGAPDEGDVIDVEFRVLDPEEVDDV